MLNYLICTFFYRSLPHLQRTHREQPKHLRAREEDLIDPLHRDLRPVRGRSAHRHLGVVFTFIIMLCYVMLCYVMLCYVMLCYVMLCYVCYVMLCYGI
jgi:hypothetical protein